MKTKIFALILVLSIALTFTSCLIMQPKLDFTEAKKNLKLADYSIDIENDSEHLEVGISSWLEARNGSDYIDIVKFDNAEYAKLYYDTIKQEYDYNVKSSTAQIKQMEYLLEEYEDELDTDEIEKYEFEIKTLNKKLKETKEDYSFGINGDIIWFGTTQAFEDARA